MGTYDGLMDNYLLVIFRYHGDILLSWYLSLSPILFWLSSLVTQVGINKLVSDVFFLSFEKVAMVFLNISLIGLG